MDMKVKIVAVFKDKISAALKKVEASTKKASSGFKKFTDNIKKGAKNARAGINKLGKSFAGIAAGAAAGAAAAVAGLVAISKQATAAGRELRNLAQVAGTPVEEFQKLAFGAQQFGITQEKLADQLKDFQDRVGDFAQTGGGPLKDFFDNIGPKVGVTIEDFQRLSGAEGIQLFQKSLEDANLAQDDMTFYLESVASDLTQLQPLLANNGKLLKENAAEAESLGIVLSEVQVEQLAEGANTFDKLQGLLTNVTNIIGVTLLPYIETLANQFIGVAKESGGFGSVTTKVVNSVIRGFAMFGDVLNGLKVVFMGLRLIALGFVGAVVSGLQLAANGIALFVDGIISDINNVISGLNSLGADIDMLPTVSDSEFMNSINEIGDNVRNMVADARSELNDLALAKTPTQQAEEFIAKSQELSKVQEEAAKQRAAEAAAKKITDREELGVLREKRLAAEAKEKADKDAAEAAKEAAKIQKQADKDAAAALKEQQTAQDEAIRERTRQMEALVGTVQNVFSTFFKDIGNGSKDAFKGLISNFKDMVNNLVSEALAAKVMSALFGDIMPTTGANGQVSGGSTGGILSGLFNGIFGREMGGGVTAGTPYIVGEKRPELFVPQQNGTIVPNLSMMGGGSNTVNINAIDSRGVADFIETNKFAMASAVQNTVSRYNVR